MPFMRKSGHRKPIAVDPDRVDSPRRFRFPRLTDLVAKRAESIFAVGMKYRTISEVLCQSLRACRSVRQFSYTDRGRTTVTFQLSCGSCKVFEKVCARPLQRQVFCTVRDSTEDRLGQVQSVAARLLTACFHRYRLKSITSRIESMTIPTLEHRIALGA